MEIVAHQPLQVYKRGHSTPPMFYLNSSILCTMMRKLDAKNGRHSQGKYKQNHLGQEYVSKRPFIPANRKIETVPFVANCVVLAFHWSSYLSHYYAQMEPILHMTKLRWKPCVSCFPSLKDSTSSHFYRCKPSRNNQ